MQGLADGYFVLPSTISDYLAPLLGTAPVPVDDPAFREAEAAVADQTKRFLSVNGTHSVDHFHRELGKIMWDNCGMARSQQTLEKALTEIPALREEFYADVKVPGERGHAQPVAGEGRPRRRLPRVRRAALPRRPHPRGVVRRALPGRAPDRRGRGAARRRELLARRRVGVRGRRHRAHAPQGAARVRVRPPRPAHVQVAGEFSTVVRKGLHTPWTSSSGSGARRAPTPPARSRPTTPRASAPRCRSSRCSTSSTTG